MKAKFQELQLEVLQAEGALRAARDRLTSERALCDHRWEPSYEDNALYGRIWSGTFCKHCGLDRDKHETRSC